MRALKIYLFLSIFSVLTAQVVSEHLYYGPSSLSMAGSDIAVPQTSWSEFVNPAGIAKQKNLSLVAGSESLFGQEYFNHSFFGVQFRLPNYGSFGLSVENFSVDYNGNSLSEEKDPLVNIRNKHLNPYMQIGLRHGSCTDPTLVTIV